MATYGTKDNGACMVVVFPRGQLTDADKAKLADSGIVAVEADDPSAVNVLSLVPGSSATVSTDDLFLSALHAVAGGSEGNRMVTELNRRLREREAAAREKVPGVFT